MRLRFITTILALVCCFGLLACARQARNAGEPSTTVLGQIIYVAPFTQPVSTSELITGFIPEQQGRIPRDMLLSLDAKLREMLTADTKRGCAWFARTHGIPDMTRFHTSEQPQALPLWVAYGKKQGAKLLLIPQVLNWNERDGSNAGVVRAAHVRVEFFLLNVPEGALAGRSIFEEEQVGLTENLLTVGSFIQRRGVWVTADVLAAEGMRKAVRELGL